MHRFRRAGEAAGVDDRDEGLQLIEIEWRFHRSHPSLVLMLKIRNIRWINQSNDGKFTTVHMTACESGPERPLLPAPIARLRPFE
jgi:hypothetical protein